MEHKDKIEQVSNPVDYLQKNSYGLYYGDDSEGFYELDWYETAEEAFNSALGTVISGMISLEELDVFAEEEELSVESKSFIQDLRQKFKSEGLSKELLESINEKLGDQQGFGWWGTFKQLKQGDELFHGDLIRSHFRGNDDSEPITDEEEEMFAEWVTRIPFTW